MGDAKKSTFITSKKLLGLSDVKGKMINEVILTPILRKLFKSHISK